MTAGRLLRDDRVPREHGVCIQRCDEPETFRRARSGSRCSSRPGLSRFRTRLAARTRRGCAHRASRGARAARVDLPRQGARDVRKMISVHRGCRSIALCTSSSSTSIFRTWCRAASYRRPKSSFRASETNEPPRLRAFLGMLSSSARCRCRSSERAVWSDDREDARTRPRARDHFLFPLLLARSLICGVVGTRKAFEAQPFESYSGFCIGLMGASAVITLLLGLVHSSARSSTTDVRLRQPRHADRDRARRCASRRRGWRLLRRARLRARPPPRFLRRCARRSVWTAEAARLVLHHRGAAPARRARRRASARRRRERRR